MNKVLGDMMNKANPADNKTYADMKLFLYSAVSILVVYWGILGCTGMHKRHVINKANPVDNKT